MINQESEDESDDGDILRNVSAKRKTREDLLEDEGESVSRERYG